MPEEDRVDEVNRFWNAIGHRETPLPDLDPDLARAIEWAMAQDDAPGPGAEFTSRLGQRLAQSTSETAKQLPGPKVSPNGHYAMPSGGVTIASIPEARERRSWGPLPLFAAAFLVVIALGIAALDRAWWSDSDRRETIPAAATTNPESIETLVEIAFPPSELPAGDVLAAGLTHITIPAGDQSTWEGNCCPGLRIYYVVEGGLMIRSYGLIHVLYAGSNEIESYRPQGVMQVAHTDESATPDSRPVGGDIRLGPGDAFFAQNEVPFVASNPGTVPVELMMIDLTTQQNDVPDGWALHAFSGALEIPRPVGGIDFQLRMVTLQESAILPKSPGSIAAMAVQFVGGGVGQMATSFVHPVEVDGSFENISTTTKEVYVLTLFPTQTEET